MLRSSLLLAALVFYSGAAFPLRAQDTTPPVTAVEVPAGNSYVSSLPSLSGTAADDVLVADVQAAVTRQSDGYYWDGLAWTASESWLTASFAAPSWTYAALPVWTNGETYSVVSRAVDGSSNWSAVYSTAVFRYDADLPVASVLSPADSSSVVSFSGVGGTAWDNGSFVSQVWVKITRRPDDMCWNGAVSQWDAAEAWNLAVGSVAWTWAGPPPAALTAGATYFVTARAQDMAGNLQNFDTAGSTFVYAGAPADVQPPAAAVLLPADGAALRSLPSLAGTAADDVAVATVTVSLLDQAQARYWSGAAWDSALPVWFPASLWPSSWTYANVPAWADGTVYTVAARAGDTSGNWSAVYSSSAFTYDVTPPAAAVTSPVSGPHASFSGVSGTAFDAHGVAQVQVGVLRWSDGLYWDGSAWAAGPLWNNSTGTASWNYGGLTEAALESGATYLFTLRAYDLAGNVSDPGAGVSTFTYAPPPAGVLTPGAFSGVGVSSLTVNWSTTHSTAAVYQVRLSSWPAAFPYLYAGSTAAVSLTFSGLAPDTSYYGFISTVPGSGFVAGGFGVTLAAVPSSVDFSSVAYTSATLSWSAGANPAWTLYEYEISTDSAFGAPAASGSAAGTGAAFSGLEQWTQYYGRVRAVNGAGVRTAYAEAFSPALTLFRLPSGLVSGLAGAAQGVSSITWTWGSGSVSDAGSFSFYSGSGVFLGTAPFGASGAYEQTGLSPNAPRMLRVRGRNAFGEGPLADGATVYTLAAVPASPAFSGVGYSSAAFGWASGGNPDGTVYEYELSESDAFGVPVSSGSGAALGTVFTGLAQGTTYYARVRAVNGGGLPTPYAAAQGVTSVLLPSGLAGGVAGTALGVSSISWTWNSGTLASADYYTVRDEAGVQLASAAFSPSAAYAQEGLGANTPHFVRVAGANGRGESPLAASATVYTLALAPGVPAGQAWLSSAAVTLDLNGNPAGTVLQLWRSADGVSFSNVYEGSGTEYADAELAECTAYYYKARARNGGGVYSGFGGALNFTTPASTPAAPGGLYAEPLDGGRIALAWEPSPSLSVSSYGVYYDNASGAVDYGAPLAVFSSTVTSWTTPALTPGATYKFAVRSGGACGTEEKNSTLLASAQAVGVLSGVRAAIKVPSAGKRVKGNSVTLVAELILGRPEQTAQVRFQYSPAGAGAWTDVDAANPNHPNPDLAAPYFVHLDADSLPPGAYDLRAVATDVYGAADPAAPVISIVADPVDYDTSESVAAGEQRKEQKISNTVTSTVQTGDDATALVTKVVIPSGAVSDSTAAVTLVNNPAAVPAPPAGADQLNLAVKVNLSNGQSRLAAGKTAALTFSYKDDDGNGVVDGTLAAVDRLRVYTVSDSGGAWSQLATTVDRDRKTVTAATPHFSFFSVFAAPASGLGAIKVYPVPWQPGTGGRFDAAGVTFGGLPSSARIRIFTLTGELVRLLEVTAADAGQKLWDGRNSEGHKAASGIYIALVKSGSDERTVKVAVER